METTAQELRDIDIRASFRGYRRDDVDAILERAATTIEHLEFRLQIREQRLPPVPSALPGALPAPADDLIERTLILAQKTADAAITEAEARAEQLVTDAERQARELSEHERCRAEAEIAELDAKRDALTADVDALERFATEYRGRIRRAIEDDFERLGAGPVVETSGSRRRASVG
ncbi:MAG TPA: DivIVA domain-containing protein [Acidimicrobiia bacterium]|nr:DivIVA domain-containing protein [Acidimicrobiia bacterium]